MTIFAILCFVIVGSAAGKANRVNRMDFEIPFDFIVKDQTFTAGKYSVERLNPNAPYVWVLRKIGGKSLAIINTQAAARAEAAGHALLSFNQIDVGYVLTAIWEPGAKRGYRVEQIRMKSQ